MRAAVGSLLAKVCSCSYPLHEYFAEATRIVVCQKADEDELHR